jgi:trigger factor
VELNDLVVLDLAGAVDGEQFFKQEGMPFIVTEDSDVPLPGFGKEIVGIAPQQSKEFDLPIPGDYPEPKVAGKTCHVAVKVGEVKAQRLPELNDEFAKGVGQGFASLDALKEQLGKNIGASEQERVRREYEEKVVQAALDQAKVVVSPLTVKHEAQHALQQRAEALARQGLKIEEVLARGGKTLDQYREELETESRKVLLTSLLLRKIADAESIQVDDAAVSEQLAGLMRQVQEQSGGRQRMREDDQNREALGRMQRSRKALEQLVAIARGAGVEPPAQAEATAVEPAAQPSTETNASLSRPPSAD